MFKAPALALALFGVVSTAQAANITGIWQTYDDDTHQARSLVEIKAQGASFEGKIIKLFLAADEPKNPLCESCEGAMKNAPILGLKILQNLREQDGIFAGGTILDPENGTLYKVKLTPSADGTSLNVRGFVGIEMMGRDQVWTWAK